MARKNKNITKFEDVSSEDQNVNVKDNINININNDVDEIFDETNHSGKLIMKGVYFDKDVALYLDKLKRTRARGFQSRFINSIVRKEFIERGYFK